MSNQFTRAQNNNTKFGLPLEAPISQSIVPVIDSSTYMVQGFFVIASQEFTEAEGEVLLPGATLPIKVVSVTPPTRVTDPTYNYGIKQYMAAVYDFEASRLKPWLGYANFIDSNHTGYFSSTHVPTEGTVFRFSRGALIQSLMVNLNTLTGMNPPPAPTPPVIDDTAAIEWVAGIEANLYTNCQFFDFNWEQLFQAKLGPKDPINDTVEPLRLEVVENPPRFFKAMLVTNSGQPTLAGGGIMFNTIRVVMLERPTAGDYIFKFKVSNVKNLSKEVTLTLTVV